jgi:glycosyltransferase involved in cell wall biosynthesis
MKDELGKRGVDRGKIDIVPNGVGALPEIKPAHADLRRKLGIGEDDKVVGYIGSFSAYEGLDVLLDACLELVQKGEKLKLLFVGDSQPIIDASAAHLADTGLNDAPPWLIQVGRVPHEQVADYYALLDAVVIPRKPLAVCQLVPPMKAAEALAYGKQLVVSGVAPLAEYADKYEGVVSFEAGSAKSLATALQGSLKLPAPQPSTELLFSAHTEPMVQALKGEEGQKVGESAPMAKPVAAPTAKPSSSQPRLGEFSRPETIELRQKDPIWHSVPVQAGQELVIEAASEYRNVKGAQNRKAVLLVNGFDAEGKRVDKPLGRMAKSGHLKAYFKYLPCTQNQVQELHGFTVPEGVREVHVGVCGFHKQDGEQVMLRELRVKPKLSSLPVNPTASFSPAVKLPFSDNLNVDFCLMSEEVKKKKTSWTHVSVAGVKKISIRAESKPKIADKKIMLRIRCFNSEGQEVEPVKGAAYFSEDYKWFRYVTVFEKGADGSQGSVDIPFSEDIASVGFSFVNLGDVNTDRFTASLKKELQVVSETVEAKKRHEDVFDYLHGASSGQALQAKAVVYGDVSPNVLDGSSIWLTSVTNIVSSTRSTLLLLKDNINSLKVVSNIERHKGLTIVEPKDIGFDAPLDQQAAAEALSLIHAHCPQITALITRGVDLGYEVQKRKEFTGIFYPYLTDFYEVGEQGFSLVDAKVAKLKEIVLNARSVLFQTDEIHKKIEEIVGYKVDGAKLPPSIPDNLAQISESDEENRDGVIHIGYAGKVQPRWGVEELIEEVERQISRGRSIKLHIATGKIHGRGKEGSAFVQRIRHLLKKEFVQLHDSLSREASISLMAQMDLVWCYRDPQLENSTLELSTKLVETVALGKPCVVCGSDINKQFLGEDYPFVVYEPSEISDLIENFESLADKSRGILKGLARKVSKEFTFSALKDRIGTKLDEGNKSSLSGKKIVVSGHDLKFIYSYITHLRRNGAEVAIDPWEWGAHISLRLSEHYSSWGDYIFCEWGLANAVWHSKNKKEGKKLFVRIHAQEVRKKAAKFGRAIDAAEVDKFIFVSSLIRQQALELFGWDEGKTGLVPNGVKENRFYDPAREIKPVLGMVGIVPTTKRLDRALDLLAALNERGWGAKLYCKGHRPEDLPFMLAPGRRQELAYYKALYKRIDSDPNLQGYVFFDGWGNDVEQWYQKVSFILSPSENESFHYALADGVMAGCIPLVWPWEGADEVYSYNWVVNNVDAALCCIQNHLSKPPNEVSQTLDMNRSFLFSKYRESLVFKRIDSFLGGAE